MTLYDEVKEKLEADPSFRERRFRFEGIVNLLREKYPVSKMISDGTLADLIKEAESVNRYVRMAQKGNPHLRGKDYQDKDFYEQKKEVSLGYEAGFVREKKLISKLF